jgi:hypothetical protein
MTELVKVTDATFSGCVVHDGKDIVLRLAGTADVAAQQHLEPLFVAIHAQVAALGVSRVQVDLRELQFMNSSCIKDVIVWLEKVRVAEKGYLVTFLSSEARPWQRRSLQALKLFAKGIVSIETC